MKRILTIIPTLLLSSSRDGRLGMGLLKQFSKVTFNFEDMFVALSSI